MDSVVLIYILIKSNLVFNLWLQNQVIKNKIVPGLIIFHLKTFS